MDRSRAAPTSAFREPRTLLVNDIHSRLNPTRVGGVVEVGSLSEIEEALEDAKRRDMGICVAGGRHAMGGQQFGTDSVLIDTTRLDKILALDTSKGLITAQAGIRWPELMRGCLELQRGMSPQWAIVQKQTGADRLSLGGALSSNVHGRGLALEPIAADVESFVIVGADGKVRRASREENTDLFRLAAGGYGLFGVIYSVTLRLAHRRKLERVVELVYAESLAAAFESRTTDGFLYGDFQFTIDERSKDFLRRGVFSCYRPVDPRTSMDEPRLELSPEDWRQLVYLAHVDKSEAFRRYSEHYIATSGQAYWSDTHQLGVYLDDYHEHLDARLGQGRRGSEVITEVYVPRRRLADFLEEARNDFLRHGVNVIYGTVRVIERDSETFLPWARNRYACIVFNIHTEHSPVGKEHSAAACRRLIDMAIRRSGSFYLTYGRYATARQVEACYPSFREFLRKKNEHDPEGLFQSDWYRHYRGLFS